MPKLVYISYFLLETSTKENMIKILQSWSRVLHVTKKRTKTSLLDWEILESTGSHQRSDLFRPRSKVREVTVHHLQVLPLRHCPQEFGHVERIPEKSFDLIFINYIKPRPQTPTSVPKSFAVMCVALPEGCQRPTRVWFIYLPCPVWNNSGYAWLDH